MSLNPGTQNIENLGNSAETLRLIFRALDLKLFAHDSIGKTKLFQTGPRFRQSHSLAHHANSSCLQLPPRTSPSLRSNSAPRELRGTVAEQCSRENPMFYGLSFKTLFRRFEIFFHARPALPKKLQGAGNSRVTIPLAKCLFSQSFHSGIATTSGDTFIAKKILRTPLNPHGVTLSAKFRS